MKKLLLACSGGGHLLQMMRLREVWGCYERVWVTLPGVDSDSLLANERVVFGYAPTTRNVPNLLRNFVLASKVMRQERPDAVLSTGGGLAIPFLTLGRLRGIPTIHCESITFSEELSVTGRLMLPVVDRMLVQWPGLAAKHRKVEYWGSVL